MASAASRELIDYVKTQLNAGYTEEQIREAIIQGGYTEEEADDAIEAAHYELQAPQPVSEPEKSLEPTGAKPVTAGKEEAKPHEAVPLEAASRIGFILSIIGGVFIIVNVALLITENTVLSDIMGSVPVLGSINLGLETGDIIVLNIILAIGVFLGAVLSHKKPEMQQTTGIVIILLSIISLLNGGGFVLSLIPLIGGILLFRGI